MAALFGWVFWTVIAGAFLAACLGGLYLQFDGLWRLRDGLRFYRNERHAIGELDDREGFVEVAGRVVGDDTVTGPFSGTQCAYCRYWVAVRTRTRRRGRRRPTWERRVEESVGRLRVTDETGTAHLEIEPGGTLRAAADDVTQVGSDEHPPEAVTRRCWEHDALDPDEHPVLVADHDSGRRYREVRLSTGDEVHVIGELTGDRRDGDPVVRVDETPGCLTPGDRSHPARHSFRTGITHALVGSVALCLGGLFLYSILAPLL